MGRVSAKQQIITFIPREYPDEVWNLRALNQQAALLILDKSQIKEYERGQLIEKYDDNLYRIELVDYLVANWSGVGIEHEDGRIDDPAPCTREHKLLVIAHRPTDFFLTLRRAAEDAARQTEQKVEEARQNFHASRKPEKIIAMPTAGSADASTSSEI